ncbi:hypothetical protein PSN45_004945 [Yamadazyma tenuis]|uniref:Rho-GAP domain-containing protein n=1 Tax=Candida tenuis (strain ATCC 10573 / BCRC 21748 / CBS 615 / JCM 9827 / NBRC 10315 / NRRL Y-1498 / VKM Y-70) TaxID=590646 RepID=G3B287_CANTC|nr:uncharacterized protein CANTEDRAFT_92858 [Yamadazyma tenuis ATCC 10573]EGV64617.1 hypothetical protein CANTEDRAFT_92858 [Yamadazyma tenuis ATCC 10573]WEJ97394.1 hypothetical protein PSN45_004945 [Yamadazyma tenuis]
MVDVFKLVSPPDGDEFRIPLILSELYAFINNDICEGIFRINGSLKKVNQYYNSLHRYHRWLPEANIYDVCSLLKKLLTTNYKFFDISKLDLGELKELSDEKFNWEYFNRFMNNNLNSLSLHIFMYTIAFTSRLLDHSDITKMSLLNFSIIFQPIFFSCDSLVGLPNYINLLNFLLKNHQKIDIDQSLIDSDFKLALSESSVETDFTDNSSFFYRFKSFKNKSIDSINDIGRKIPFSNDITFKGYRFNNRSVDMVSFLKDNRDSLSDQSKDEESAGTVITEVPENGPITNSESTQSVSSSTDPQIGSQDAQPDPEPESNPEYTHTLEPPTHKFPVFEIDESIDPLTVDPEINAVIHLKDIDTQSFQFDVDLDSSSNSSFHSLNDDSDDTSNQMNQSNFSNDTNDTSFQISELSHKPSMWSLRSHKEPKHSKHHESKTTRKKPTSKLAQTATRKRSSTILSRVESRLDSKSEPRSSCDTLSSMEKRRSLAKVFKNEGIKFPLKLKSKSIY